METSTGRDLDPDLRRFLSDQTHAREVLRLLDGLTASVEGLKDRKSDEFQAFRKGMGYCWSVAVAALPEEGKPLMEKWFSSA